jgi:glycosyltransferase involved in cell wall biosynthesis
MLLRRDYASARRVKASEFEVSIVIPVYNAEDTITRAVESAISLRPVQEVILVEDNSPDDSLRVCSALAERFEKVKLIRHADGANHGAGASRNLGVSSASRDYVAFLDADDWYLPNRFVADESLLLRDATADGIYNALANDYATPEDQRQWLSQGWPEVATLSESLPPDELFDVLMWVHPRVTGDFHLDTLTVRRETLARIGGFDTELKLQQDTHFIRCLASVGRLLSGNLVEPVAMRGVHAKNRMTRLADHEQYFELWWSSLWRKLVALDAKPDRMQTYRKAYARFRAERGPRLRALVALGNWVIREPREALKPYSHFDLVFRSIFKENNSSIRLLSFKNRVSRTLT